MAARGAASKRCCRVVAVPSASAEFLPFFQCWQNAAKGPQGDHKLDTLHKKNQELRNRRHFRLVLTNLGPFTPPLSLAVCLRPLFLNRRTYGQLWRVLFVGPRMRTEFGW